MIKNIVSLENPKHCNRIDLYDFLRGMAMLLVLLQHAVIPGWRYLCVFHMPLFFFLSGLVSGYKKMPPFGRYVRLRFKRLIIPYFAFGVIDVVLHTLLDMFYYHQGYSILGGLCGILTGQREFGGGVGIYWFLITMFVADLLIYPINKYVVNCNPVKWGGVFVLLMLSYCSSHWFDLSLFTLDKSFMAAAFILVGSLCKQQAKYLEDTSFRWVEALLILLGITGVIVSRQMNEQTVLMYINQYGNYLWFAIGAISGILATLLIGKYLFLTIKNRKGILYRLLMWMGYNSLVLFPVHLQIKMYVGKVIYAQVGTGNFYHISILITMLFLGVPICNFISHYLPWLLGMKFSQR